MLIEESYFKVILTGKESDLRKIAGVDGELFTNEFGESKANEEVLNIVYNRGMKDIQFIVSSNWDNLLIN